MADAHPFMPTRAEGHDPNLCAAKDCGQVWNAITHQPSLYLAALGPYRAAVSDAVSRLSEGAGVPSVLLHAERASGPPRDPSADAMAATWENTAAPATHTGRPSMHSGAGRLVPDPDFVTLGQSGRGKTLINPMLSAQATVYADMVRKAAEAEQDKLIAKVQDSEVWQVPDEVRAREAQEALDKLGRLTQPLKRNGVTTEFHKCDATDVHEPHLWQPGANTEWFTCAGDLLPDEPDYCDHPNGFGVNGCPCGAVAPDEDAPRTFRNLDTGEDEYAIRCPATLDHAYDVYPVSQMVRHLGRDHGWSQDKIDDWAESVGVATQSMIPDPLVEAIAQNKQLEADMVAFLDPSVTVEDLMHGQDKPMDFHAWWVAMADREAPTVQRKAEEYGTNSLVEMGRIWARAQGRDVTDLEAVEIGCFLYAYGKIQRVADALLKGKSPNVDSWHDLTIYSLMVQFSREKGTWP